MNNKIKKSLKCSLAVLVIMAISAAFCWQALAADEEVQTYTEGIFTYTVSDSAATITACDRAVEGDLIIPDKLGGYPVVEIGEMAFAKCNALTSLEIPEGVTKIGNSAIKMCVNLVTVKMPNTVTELGKALFAGDTALKNVTVSSAVTALPRMIFLDCHALETVTLPEGSLELIDYGAFQRCLKLKSINIPSTVTEIGLYAFAECAALESIELPAGLMTVPAYSFRLCESLEKVTMPNSITKIGEYAFSECTELVQADLPENLEYLGERAFYKCTSLKSVVMPDTLTHLGKSVCNTSGVETVVLSKNLDSIPAAAFYDCKNLKSVSMSDSVKIIYSEAFENCSSLESIELPKGLTRVEFYAFLGCENIKELSFPESLEFVGSGAFGKTGLTAVELSCGIERIHNDAFAWCKELETVVLPDSIVSVAESAFANCSKLKSVTVPNSIKYIFEKAFYNCDGITDVYFKGTVAEWNAIMIHEGNESLLNADIHYLNEPPHVCSYQKDYYLAAHPHYAAKECECGNVEIDESKTLINGSCELCRKTELPKLVSIEIVSPPDKVVYFYKDAVKRDGIKVIGTYSDGQTVDMSSAVGFKNFNTQSIGERTATVYYGSVSDTFTYTVEYSWWQQIIRILLLGIFWY